VSVASSGETRGWGKVFNDVAEEYDRHRPAYPDRLIDQACLSAGLVAGDRVLEIGCGTGQLTRSLLARGLRVTAVEPGELLISQTRRRLAGAGEVEFVPARVEEAPLPPRHYRAAFSASAMHWVDPAVGWRRLADALSEGGCLALLSYFGLDEPRSRGDQEMLRAGLGRIAPELLAEWPAYRDLDALRAGAAARENNISDVWAWLGSYDVARRYVVELFDPAALTALPIALEQTAGELNALLGTMSFWARLTPDQRDALVNETQDLQQRLGRPIRSSTAACLVTATVRVGLTASD
jgi:SAM-dependent methyltransferase